MSTVEEIRAQAQQVAAGWAGPDAPDSWQLTAALFRVIAAHEALLRRLTVLPADRLPALLASAAISLLVRRDRPMPLAGYFPEPGAAQPGFDAGFYPAARSFVSARLDDIEGICAGAPLPDERGGQVRSARRWASRPPPRPGRRSRWPTWARGPGSGCSLTGTGT